MVRKKVLFIEDDVALGTLLESILKEKYDVKMMDNSIDAWFWLMQGNQPDIIITDFLLPGADGLEFIENVRTSGMFFQTPVILLTGFSDDGLKEECGRLNISAIVSKPFRPQALLETTEYVLQPENSKFYA